MDEVSGGVLDWECDEFDEEMMPAFMAPLQYRVEPSDPRPRFKTCGADANIAAH